METGPRRGDEGKDRRAERRGGRRVGERIGAESRRGEEGQTVRRGQDGTDEELRTHHNRTGQRRTGQGRKLWS